MTAAPSFVENYAQAGFSFVHIARVRGKPTKGPTLRGWNLPYAEDNPNGFTPDIGQAKAWLTAGDNIGLALGPSRVLSFDIDDLAATREVFTSLGVPLDAWMTDPARHALCKACWTWRRHRAATRALVRHFAEVRP